MPQLVHGNSCSGGTNVMARLIVSATCSGLSTLSVATSIAPTNTSFPLSSASNSIGTREFAHSSEI